MDQIETSGMTLMRLGKLEVMMVIMMMMMTLVKRKKLMMIRMMKTALWLRMKEITSTMMKMIPRLTRHLNEGHL